MLLNCGVGEDSWESIGLQGDPTSPSLRKSALNIHWKEWCWSWNSNTLATWCEELTHWINPWSWERSKAGREEDDRGWDGWMASPTQWTCIWASSGSWWSTQKPACYSLWGHKDSDMTEQLNWIISNVEHLFTCLLAISLEKCLFRSSAQFSTGWVFFLLSCMSYLYILEIKPLSVALFANIFSHSVGCFSFCVWFPLLHKNF